MGRHVAAAAAAVALAAAAGVAAFVAPPGSSAGARKAALAIVADEPLTVRGTSFGRYERVQITVYPMMRRKKVTAGSRGGFTVRFTAVNDPCRPFRVVAVGARGSHAVVREIPPPCVPIVP